MQAFNSNYDYTNKSCSNVSQFALHRDLSPLGFYLTLFGRQIMGNIRKGKKYFIGRLSFVVSKILRFTAFLLKLRIFSKI